MAVLLSYIAGNPFKMDAILWNLLFKKPTMQYNFLECNARIEIASLCVQLKWTVSLGNKLFLKSTH